MKATGHGQLRPGPTSLMSCHTSDEIREVVLAQTAVSLWYQLQNTGLPLGSPAVASNAATPGSWLDQFMSQVQSRGLRVDFIALHWSGSNFDTSTAVSQLQQYIQAVHARYQLPIWLTQVSILCTPRIQAGCACAVCDVTEMVRKAAALFGQGTSQSLQQFLGVRLSLNVRQGLRLTLSLQNAEVLLL